MRRVVAPAGVVHEHHTGVPTSQRALALGVALFTSLACAVIVTWFVSRRLRAPLGELTDAARELSRDHYTGRVPPMGGGTELDTLADAFNSMAGRLEDVENTRRRLLSDLAHELRTPIATLTVYHEGLFDGVTDLGEDTQAVLTSQTDRLDRLADDIDDVSRAEEGRLSLDRKLHLVKDLVLRSADAVRGRFDSKGVNLVVDLTRSAGITIDADRNRIGQVLGNLLANALRHTPAGGHVTVSTSSQDDEVLITVADDGDGIPPDQLPHVFERFYRGDTARTRDSSGSGIGLTISKAIIDAHGGTIMVFSDGPGHGASRSSSPQPRAAPDRRHTATSLGGRHIFDDAHHRVGSVTSTSTRAATRPWAGDRPRAWRVWRSAQLAAEQQQEPLRVVHRRVSDAEVPRERLWEPRRGRGYCRYGRLRGRGRALARRDHRDAPIPAHEATLRVGSGGAGTRQRW